MLRSHPRATCSGHLIERLGTPKQALGAHGSAWKRLGAPWSAEAGSGSAWERLGAPGSAWERRSRLWERLGAPGSAGAASASSLALGGPERPWTAEIRPWAAQTDPAEASGCPQGFSRLKMVFGGRKQALDGPKAALGGRKQALGGPKRPWAAESDPARASDSPRGKRRFRERRWLRRKVKGDKYLGSPSVTGCAPSDTTGRARQWAAAGTPIVLRPCSLSSGRARAHFVSGSALASLGFRV